jgi:hypothetical protein
MKYDKLIINRLRDKKRRYLSDDCRGQTDVYQIAKLFASSAASLLEALSNSTNSRTADIHLARFCVRLLSHFLQGRFKT